ncbi:MAG: DHA2 family efflux MFS transporter permease subunit [Thermoleophilaceae bacterium]
MTRLERSTIAITGAALFMVVLDNLIVAATLPSIERSLGSSLATLEWVLDAYILAFAVLMLTAAALGERYGRRRMFVAGVILFTVSSAAGALAPNVETLIAARALEGIGGAIITPLTLTLLTGAFAPERRSVALGAWSAIAGIGVAAGPIAGGILTSALSWHWVFWVNVPVGIAIAALTPRLIAESRGRRERLDLGGLALATAGLFAVVFATVRANAVGWASLETLATYAAGAALLAGFLRWEARHEHAMVPPRLFETRQFGGANAANFLLAFAMFSGFVMVVQFLSSVLHESPVSVGLHSLFWTAAPMVVSPWAARLGRTYGPIRIATGGLVLAGIGLLTLALTVAPDINPLALAPGLLAIGTGIGLVLPNVVAAALAVIPEADIGKASGVLNTARQVGAVVGVAVGVAVFQTAGGAGASELSDGIRTALILSASAAGAGALAARASRPRVAAEAVAVTA